MLCMDESKTMVQTEVLVDGVPHLLAQGQDVDEIKRQIEVAISGSGNFVDIVVVGNRTVSVLVTPRSRVAISVATVLHDDRDDGDLGAPFGGFYDFG